MSVDDWEDGDGSWKGGELRRSGQESLIGLSAGAEGESQQWIPDFWLEQLYLGLFLESQTLVFIVSEFLVSSLLG